MKRILIINGANLNMLGIREPGIYGSVTYDELTAELTDFAATVGVSVDIVHSNIEGEIVNFIQGAMGVYNGIVINPGAYTHYSYAIYDAVKSIDVPTVEAHISNIHKREEFRDKSVIVPACVGQICGLGIDSYKLAIRYISGVI